MANQEAQKAVDYTFYWTIAMYKLWVHCFQSYSFSNIGQNEQIMNIFLEKPDL